MRIADRRRVSVSSAIISTAAATPTPGNGRRSAGEDDTNGAHAAGRYGSFSRSLDAAGDGAGDSPPSVSPRRQALRRQRRVKPRLPEVLHETVRGAPVEVSADPHLIRRAPNASAERGRVPQRLQPVRQRLGALARVKGPHTNVKPRRRRRGVSRCGRTCRGRRLDRRLRVRLALRGTRLGGRGGLRRGGLRLRRWWRSLRCWRVRSGSRGRRGYNDGGSHGNRRSDRHRMQRRGRRDAARNDRSRCRRDAARNGRSRRRGSRRRRGGGRRRDRRCRRRGRGHRLRRAHGRRVVSGPRHRRIGCRRSRRHEGPDQHPACPEPHDDRCCENRQQDNQSLRPHRHPPLDHDVAPGAFLLSQYPFAGPWYPLVRSRYLLVRFWYLSIRPHYPLEKDPRPTDQGFRYGRTGQVLSLGHPVLPVRAAVRRCRGRWPCMTKVDARRQPSCRRFIGPILAYSLVTGCTHPIARCGRRELPRSKDARSDRSPERMEPVEDSFFPRLPPPGHPRCACICGRCSRSCLCEIYAATWWIRSGVVAGAWWRGYLKDETERHDRGPDRPEAPATPRVSAPPARCACPAIGEAGTRPRACRAAS